ncbi:methyltransferase domain-containing protein [Planctomicrobium sp. SH661]|uniref:methyltransferase domain-containing protein n=1 Tax=Planctomicrobium sp. SH661 TaxID=3448124 RepID=UPI003F5B0B85
MSWKLKAHTLGILSRMPAGRSLYHFLQKCAGTNRLNVRRDLNRAFELVDLVHQAGDTIEGATCLEVGTGWRPFVPFVLALGGAKRVITVDVNPWLTPAYASETWKSLELFLPEIAANCRLPEHEVWDRFRKVPRNAKTLKAIFDPLNIEYIYPGDARATGLPDNSVDIVLSSNVLEHIPRDIQLDIHRESLRILRAGGLTVHRFNPQDHYATVDSQITHANFLQFSSEEWHWLGGSGLAYHNRLRSRDYRELFDEAGLNIEICRERVDPRSLEAIQKGTLAVHPEFQRYTAEELAADYMWTVCRKPVQVSVERQSPSAAKLVSETV